MAEQPQNGKIGVCENCGFTGPVFTATYYVGGVGDVQRTWCEDAKQCDARIKRAERFVFRAESEAATRAAGQEMQNRLNRIAR